MSQKYPNLAPFYIENNIQTKLKNNDQSFLEEEVRRQRSQLSPYIDSDSCVPNCYVKTLECCGNQIVWMRVLCPCICLCTESPFWKQSNANFGVVQNFGRFKKLLNPGLNFINPLTQKVITISKQTQIIQYSQPIFTKDNIACIVKTVIYVRVIDCIEMLYKLGESSLYLAIQEIVISAVRSLCSQSLFQDLIEKRNKFSKQLSSFTNQPASVWGIYIQHMFIKDIILDNQLQSVMSEVAKTKRRAEATLLGAKSLVQTAHFYKDASEALDTKSAQQIRYLNTLGEISQTESQKILMLRMSRNQ